MNARIAAARARRELEFLEVCEGYQDRLEAAKERVQQAAEQGDVPAELLGELKNVSREMYEFRAWARATGKPREGGPGDAVIVMGGAVSGVGR